MAFAGFLGCGLIAGGPGLALFCIVLARRSLIVLLVLACAFLWLVGLLLTSLILRGLLPLETAGAQAAALVLGVIFQEGIRYGCFLLHRRLVVSLNGIAEHMEGVRKLNVQDEQLLALGQGWAHAATHSIFFYYSWLPLYLGDATLYLEACPRMSFFLAGALLTLGFNLLHTFSMVLAFSGWAHRRRERWIAVPCAHLLAALLTLSNLRRNGCLGGIPVVLLLGLGSMVAAGAVCWKDVREPPAQTHELLPADDEPIPAQHIAASTSDHER